MSKVLIVIPVYNGVAEFLGDCLSSLINIDLPREKYDILAIDDCSADNSAAYIQKNFPTVFLIKNDFNRGFTGTNNIGLRYALEHGYDYVYLLNQDTMVDANFLAVALAQAKSDERIGAVQSKLLLFHAKDKINSLGNVIHFLGFAYAGGYLSPDRMLAAGEITYPSGAAVLFKTKALRDVGLLNEEFYMYHEDVDLGWRLWLGGWKIMLAPQSIVYHKYEFSRSIQKYFFMERNRYLVLMQNYKIATLILILPALAAMALAMLVYSFIAGWWRQELQVCRYFLKWQSWAKLMETRAQVQRKRRVKDRVIANRFAGTVDFQDLQNPLLKYLVNPAFNVYWQIVKHLIWW